MSGGADSTALLHCLAHSLNAAKVAVAHINHGLRGDESDGDALFVRRCAEQYGLRYIEYRIQPKDWYETPTGSLEGTARQIRYRFLTQTAEQLGFRYAATAHTADDQTETVLHRIFRGTGLTGLAGMRPFRQLSDAVTLIRPLLKITRNEIAAYLQEFDIPFRVDSSNLENDFTRNRIRNRLLPQLREEYNPQLDTAVRHLAQLAEENETVLDELLQDIAEQIVVRQTEQELILDRCALQRWSSTVQRELLVRFGKRAGLPLREMGLKQWEQLVVFLTDKASSLELPGSIIALKDQQTVRLLRPIGCGIG